MYQGFRDEHLWTLEINDILDANLTSIKTIYDKYVISQGPWMRYLSIKSCSDWLIEKAGLPITEADLLYYFGMSKMTIPEETKAGKQYEMIYFVEFLEMIVRASLEQKMVPDDIDELPIFERLKDYLDKLFSPFGLQRQEVNIVMEAVSESDDDY